MSVRGKLLQVDDEHAGKRILGVTIRGGQYSKGSSIHYRVLCIPCGNSRMWWHAAVIRHFRGGPALACIHCAGLSEEQLRAARSFGQRSPVNICAECCNLAHRRPLRGCPKCRRPFAAEALERPTGYERTDDLEGRRLW